MFGEKKYKEHKVTVIFRLNNCRVFIYRQKKNLRSFNENEKNVFRDVEGALSVKENSSVWKIWMFDSTKNYKFWRHPMY